MEFVAVIDLKLKVVIKEWNRQMIKSVLVLLNK